MSKESAVFSRRYSHSLVGPQACFVPRPREVGAELKSDNIYELELKNGSRVLALPSTDDSIRGLTVDGWIVADEAARLTNDLISALRPMRARCPQARFAMLSTAWSRTDPFWTAWTDEDPSWMRLKATADTVSFFPEEFLAQERRALGEDGFKREYLGIPVGSQASSFNWGLYERATRIQVPLVQPGPAFQPPIEAPAVRIANPFQRLQASGVVR